MTAPNEPKLIKLSYHCDPNNKGVYTITSVPSTIRFEPGETVSFKATVAEGSGYKLPPGYNEPRIRVIFEPPNRFQPSVFRTGDDPVRVLAAAQAVGHGAGYGGSPQSSASAGIKVMLQCGLIDENGNLIGKETGHIGEL
jgi:hypothetical protein